MNSLAVFEMAARYLSFTRAAEELTISREAVSRHIRVLEDHLGVPLFNRLYRALELTDAGHRFRAAVEESLDQIRLSARSIREPETAPAVTVLATIAISSFWLTPRLPRFRMRAPNVRIRILASDQLPDFRATRIDVGLVYGDGNWPGLEARPLFPVRSFPICSPGYAREMLPISMPADLPGHTLLNLEGDRHSSEDWAWWLAQCGGITTAGLQVIDFDNYANVIQAALEGQGVALGFSGLVDDLIDRGSLVRPIATEMDPGRSVYLVTPVSASPKETTVRFVDWITDETRRN